MWRGKIEQFSTFFPKPRKQNFRPASLVVKRGTDDDDDDDDS